MLEGHRIHLKSLQTIGDRDINVDIKITIADHQASAGKLYRALHVQRSLHALEVLQDPGSSLAFPVNRSRSLMEYLGHEAMEGVSATTSSPPHI